MEVCTLLQAFQASRFPLAKGRALEKVVKSASLADTPTADMDEQLRQ